MTFGGLGWEAANVSNVIDTSPDTLDLSLLTGLSASTPDVGFVDRLFLVLAFLAERGRGVYAGPLRMLAQEAHRRLSATLGAERVGLITGEERVNEHAPIVCCTVEMAPGAGDVLVLDEVQWADDEERGSAWTRLMLAGEYRESKVPIAGSTMSWPRCTVSKNSANTPTTRAVIRPMRRRDPRSRDRRRPRGGSAVLSGLESMLLHSLFPAAIGLAGLVQRRRRMPRA